MAIIQQLEVEVNAHIKINEKDAQACIKILEIYLTNNEDLKLEYDRNEKGEAIITIKERKMEIKDSGNGPHFKKYLD